MKLIAEIDGEDGRTARLTCDGEKLKLTVGSFAHGGQVEVATVPLDEFRKALDAVAPKPARGVMLADPRPTGEFIPIASATAYARNPDGSRIGPSPRYGMRARPAPEANGELEAALEQAMNGPLRMDIHGPPKDAA